MILTPQLLRWTIRDISFLLYHWVVIVNRNMRSAALRCLGIVGLRSFMEDGGGTAAAVMVMVMVMVDVDCGLWILFWGARAARGGTGGIKYSFTLVKYLSPLDEFR